MTTETIMIPQDLGIKEDETYYATKKDGIIILENQINSQEEEDKMIENVKEWIRFHQIG